MSIIRVCLSGNGGAVCGRGFSRDASPGKSSKKYRD